MRNKYYALNALFGLLVLGLIYAWSVFVGALEAEFGWSRAETSLNFSICMAMFCLGGLAAGGLLKVKTPRQALIFSALSILAGFFFSSRMNTLTELYIFYGVLCGFGVGVGYNVLISTTLQWFPGRQGIVSGVLLMGFGAGGSLLGSAALFMMNAMGWRKTFMALGVVLSGLIFLVSLNVKRPAPNQIPEKAASDGQNFSTGQMLRDWSFYANYVRALTTTAVGLTLLANAATLANSIYKDATFAALVGGLVSLFNGLGRVAGGAVFDKFGSRKALMLGVAGMFLGTLALVLAVLNNSVLLLAAGYAAGGFFYGNNVACQSGFISKIYGLRDFSANFGVSNTSILFASFAGPYVSGVLFTRTGGYAVPYIALTAMCCVSFAANELIRRHSAPPR